MKIIRFGSTVQCFWSLREFSNSYHEFDLLLQNRAQEDYAIYIYIYCAIKILWTVYRCFTYRLFLF